MDLSDFDNQCMHRAVSQALKAGNQQNLPIGAAISLNKKIIAVGKNAIWHPKRRLDRHAEMDALAKIPQDLLQSTKNMTLYTTLEPCLMCLGAILLYGIGRVVFGAVDPYGGAVMRSLNLPTFFTDRFSTTIWIGPAYPIECDPLYQRIVRLENLPGQK